MTDSNSNDNINITPAPATAAMPALKRFIIVERQSIKNVFEVWARDEEHAAELFEDEEAEEIYYGDIKHSEYEVQPCGDDSEDEKESEDADEEE